MLLLFPQWQLWNQIFQYQFAKSIVKKWEKIITSHSPYFSIIDESGKQCFKFVPWRKIRKYVNFWYMKICEILSKLKIISHIVGNTKKTNNFIVQDKWYKIKKWLLRNVSFIDWFFMTDDVHLHQNLKIKKQYINEGKRFLSEIPSNLKKIFIHVRRGDFLQRNVLWENWWAVLPIDYYNSVIKYFKEKYNDVAYIFLSDDIGWCKQKFSTISNCFFSNHSVWTDLAIMTSCDGWWISASSFSYLWGYYCKWKLEKIGPKFFFGFKKSVWSPNWIDSNKFMWIDVKA